MTDEQKNTCGNLCGRLVYSSLSLSSTLVNDDKVETGRDSRGELIMA